MSRPDFVPFPKLARFSRLVIVTEKIDGTNAQVHVTAEGEVFAGSRNQWIGVDGDNFGFARWVREHETELKQLGPGTHFGEWWGQGIQRGYGLTEKRFSLFNVSRWRPYEVELTRDGHARTPALDAVQVAPPPCWVVPVLWAGNFDDLNVGRELDRLRASSWAAPGYLNPEGIVVWHTAANVGFKKTLSKDDEPKGARR